MTRLRPPHPAAHLAATPIAHRAGRLAAAIVAAVVLVPAAARADSGWEETSHKAGIVVDRRAVEGSPLKEFRGRGVVDAPVPAILAVFNDIPHATEWMDSCNGSRLVEDRGELHKVVYNRTHAPWPASDRDAVLVNDLAFDAAEGRVRLEFRAIPSSAVGPVKGVVRMPYLRGHWYLWPTADGRATRVEYQVHADPGGWLPDALVNYVSKELPHRTIVGLREQVKRRSFPEVEQHIRAMPEYQALEKRLAVATPAAGAPR